MHIHDQSAAERDPLRPKSRLDEERPEAVDYQAAVAGRADVLGAEGMLRMQRVVGNDVVQRLATEQDTPVGSVLTQGGSPLAEPVRADMEARFGTDFSDVRVHTGDDAHVSAKSVHAHAYTAGSNIVFQRGMFDPQSAGGRTMLAHELTHVVQQRSGPVDGTPTGQGYQVSDPGDRFEREASANADRIVGMPSPIGVAVGSAQRTSPGSVQRHEDASLQGHVDSGAAVQREGEVEEEAVQGSFEPGAAVQREGEEEDEAPA
ncbi:MAG: DUF4157 domain-containing protein [Dermatophilaceae bacterium]